MVRPLAIALLWLSTAQAQPFLPRCGAGLDGQVGEGGCVCRYDGGGLLAGRGPGWRWSCDLLRGPGASPVPPAPGFADMPGRTQRGSSPGY